MEKSDQRELHPNGFETYITSLTTYPSLKDPVMKGLIKVIIIVVICFYVVRGCSAMFFFDNPCFDQQGCRSN